MATSSTNVTAENLLSATVRYSNKDDASRVYYVTANVNITGGKVSSFDSGEVRRITSSPDSPENMPTIPATFNGYGDRVLNVYVNDADLDESKLIFETICAFVADVRASVATTPENE